MPRWLAFLVLMAWAAGCGEEQGDMACLQDQDCASGQACHPLSGQCLEVASAVQSLEVWPPANNNQGWVPLELSSPIPDALGRLKLTMEQGVSLQGRIYASDSPKSDIPARIVAWRSSLIKGRPSVRFDTSVSSSSKRADGTMPYVLWVNKGHSYTLYVEPESPHDVKYPPLVLAGLKVSDHAKKDLVLEGLDRSVEVQGRILDASGSALPFVTVKDSNNKDKELSPSVRVMAYEEGGLGRSTLATTEPRKIVDTKTQATLVEAGSFSFRVPSSLQVPPVGKIYTLKVESISGNLPIPTVTCTSLVLGIFSGSQAKQTLGDLYLPAFLIPQEFHMTVKGKDGTPVVGATVKFSLAFSNPPHGEGFSGCKAQFDQTSLTDASGQVKVMLLPGSDKKNQTYQVTVTSPPSSRFQSRYLPKLEVGAKGGVLAPVALEERLGLKGRVVQGSGTAVAGASIEAQGITVLGTTSNIPVAKTYTTSGEDGTFSLWVEPGIYNLNIQPPEDTGLPGFGLRNKRIDASLDNLLFKAPQARALGGWVVGSSGEALSSFTVEVYEAVYETTKSLKAVLRASDLTSDKGSFLLLLPPAE